MKIGLCVPHWIYLSALLLSNGVIASVNNYQFDIVVSAGGANVGHSEGYITFLTGENANKIHGIGFSVFYASSEVKSFSTSFIFSQGFLGQSAELDDVDNLDDDALTDKRVLVAWFSPGQELAINNKQQLVNFEVSTTENLDNYAGLNLIPAKTPSIYASKSYSSLIVQSISDEDNDGVDDAIDNCPTIANTSQVNTDRAEDGGDACDEDDDNDGIDDVEDAYPLTSIGDLPDSDNDGAPDSCEEECIENGMAADQDDDNDGVLDEDDAYPLDPTKSRQDPAIVKNDTNGDGNADILWRNLVDGRNWLWTMNGRSIISSAGINVIADQAWQIVGRGDFDGDGMSDILWRNSNTGRNYIYLMDGFTIKQQGQLNYVRDTNWQVAEVADVDGDGKDDVIWRHATQGRTWIYLMKGMTTKSSQGSLTVADLNWEIVASGDVNGDDKADVIWRHKTRGDNYVWLMNGTQIANRYVLNRVASSDWTIAGAGDIDGDGTDDIIWRNQFDGRNWAYLMNDGQIQTSSLINGVANLNWQIADISDLDGDGKADLFWRQTQSGQSYIYLMNGLNIQSQGYSTTVGTSWQVQH